jgi:hypothetical protein
LQKIAVCYFPAFLIVLTAGRRGDPRDRRTQSGLPRPPLLLSRARMRGRCPHHERIFPATSTRSCSAATGGGMRRRPDGLGAILPRSRPSCWGCWRVRRSEPESPRQRVPRLSGWDRPGRRGRVARDVDPDHRRSDSFLRVVDGGWRRSAQLAASGWSTFAAGRWPRPLEVFGVNADRRLSDLSAVANVPRVHVLGSPSTPTFSGTWRGPANASPLLR